MHRFLFPIQDTYISSVKNYQNLNFGLDEILRVGTEESLILYNSPTTVVPISSSVTNLPLVSFTGFIFSSSLIGMGLNSSGSISTNGMNQNLVTSNFNGSLIGSYISSSSDINLNFSGSLTNFSGQFSGMFSGFISGSFNTDFVNYYDGFSLNFNGTIVNGGVDGDGLVGTPSVQTVNVISPNRALIQFDINSISESISNGSINNPSFYLKVYVAREFNLPIQYNLYAFPLSESWVMGDGYFWDGGSLNGASWLYRDYSSGTPWAFTGSSYIQSLSVTQSFNYQVGDVNVDISPIVYSWLSGSIPNNGIVLISSDEFSVTGSGTNLYFFSKDTNTIYEPILDVSWNDSVWSTGSISTSSVNITTISSGLNGIISNSGSITTSSLYGGFSGFGNISIDNNMSASGVIGVVGVNGLILSMSIDGNISGTYSSSISFVAQKCQTCNPNFSPQYWSGGSQFQGQYEGHDIYGWGHGFNEFNQYDWTSDHVYQEEFGYCRITGSYSFGNYVTMSYILGTILNGNFSSSTFTSSFYNNYLLGYGILSGSWSEGMISGSYLTSTYPFTPFFPSAVNIFISGSYLTGSAFGSFTNLSSSNGLLNYGIFNGVFTTGMFMGLKIYAPFSGSILTSSYSYTSSFNLTSSALSPLDTSSPFSIVLQNIPSSVKNGNLIRIDVFSRSKYPLKNFNKQTQFSQFLTPQYLPSSSYYSIKDNETEQVILDFDDCTSLSCDSNGNYFILDTTCFPQERYFRLLIKIEEEDSVYTIDTDTVFKIVR